MRQGRRPRLILSTMLLLFCVAATISFSGCGQTAKPTTPVSAGKVYSYFSGPFSAAVNFSQSISTFDHAAGSINASNFTLLPTGRVPTEILSGTFVSAPTGFLSITENFALNSSQILTPQNPPVLGAWAVEIPGGGALGNLLALQPNGSTPPVSAAPVAMAENAVCPNFGIPTSFLYVTVPTTSTSPSIADYGSIDISTQGSAVTLKAQPSLVGPTTLTPSTVTGGCSETYYGPLTAYPLNSFGTASNLELIDIGNAGLLVSSFSGISHNSIGAFGGRAGVIGVAESINPVDVSAVIGAKYNGFLYDPQNSPTANFDITTLASAYGDFASNSQTCSMLQSSLAANHGQGANSVATLPSANSLFGGEFLAAIGTGTVNDPSGANGPENCDTVIDLGDQDPINNGLFPNATIFIGSNFPPFSASHPWSCFGKTNACAVSFPAAAVVGQVQGQYVIFVVASASSNPAAQLPNNTGSPIGQPIGIYLFQRPQ